MPNPYFPDSEQDLNDHNAQLAEQAEHEDCPHDVTNGAGACLSCGHQVTAVETRPCGGCKHFTRWQGAKSLGSCGRLNMQVVSSMRVTYKTATGTCFEGAL